MKVVPQVKKSLRKSSVVFVFLVPALISLGLLASCGGGGGSSSSNLFVISSGATSVGIFPLSSGGVIGTSSSSVATGPSPQSILVTPTHTFAYVTDDGGPVEPGGVYEYTVGSTTGALANVNPNPGSTTSTTTTSVTINAGITPVAMATDAKGTLLFVANKGSNDISVYTIDQTTGMLTEVAGSPFPAGAAAPVQLAVNGTNLFVADAGNGSGGAISVFSFDAKSGALTAVSGSPFAAGQHLSSLDVDPSGKFVYVTDDQLNEVLGFSIGSGGTLTALATASYPTGTTPVYVKVNPKGGAVYVVNSGSNNLSVFTMDSSGALTAGTTVDVGKVPVSLGFDATGKYLFVANSAGDNISAFQASGSSLTAVKGSPFTAQGYTTPVSVAAD